MIRVLVVEDEQHLADGLRFNLEAEGYGVDTASNGEAALQLVETEAFDVVVLDVMLPGIDGFTVARTLRENNLFVPILMLTARGRPEDVLRGFEAGADDYLTKPFELTILLARVGALVRRRAWFDERRDASQNNSDDADTEAVNTATISSGVTFKRGAGKNPTGAAQPADSPDVYLFDNRVIDFGALELRVEERVVRLTLMEADLLRYLVRHAGRIVSRKQMLEEVWGLREDTDTRAIDNFIVRLRKYIEDEPSRPRYLLTVRGVGYRFIPMQT